VQTTGLNLTTIALAADRL